MDDTTVIRHASPSGETANGPGRSLDAGSLRWLLLFHQLPPKPAYFRVKIWRRLQTLGAVSVKNSVYVLPLTEQTQEDFHWLLREITQGGGEGAICEARFVDGLSDGQIRDIFISARNGDYEKLLNEAKGLNAAYSSSDGTQKDSFQQQVTRLRKRFQEVASIDFFPTTNRQDIERLLGSLYERMQAPVEGDILCRSETLSGRIWVTHKDVHALAMASGWVIRRFLDPAATFKFVSGWNYRPLPKEILFNMPSEKPTGSDVSFTFEALLVRAGLADNSALKIINEIVGDLENDKTFHRSETAGIALLLDGITAVNSEDSLRLTRSAAVFDDLYEYFLISNRGADQIDRPLAKKNEPLG